MINSIEILMSLKLLKHKKNQKPQKTQNLSKFHNDINFQECS